MAGSEPVRVGGTFLWQFYVDVEQYLRHAAVYTRAVREAMVQYPDAESVPSEVKNALVQYARALREIAQLAKVRYLALAQKLPQIHSETLEKKIDELVKVDDPTKLLPDPRLVEEIAVELGKVLANKVIDDLLVATKDVYAEVASAWNLGSTESTQS